ncbi:hypothetical protein [Blautia sp. MSJ-9]|uniref:hypothetical protein n=1 Tax=Blautia sp. MSJ-9 TaxID=2841511 RepID=UPI001C121286|nr:hypothetical protein [Blautia sp. MSJ-9]MBU5681319.1 hypothetical protein [Blautia sp. MSJ-9]
MKRLIIKNKRRIWIWFLLIVFLILACRAAYITGNRVGRMEKNDTESAVQSGDDDQIYKVAV